MFAFFFILASFVDRAVGERIDLLWCGSDVYFRCCDFSFLDTVSRLLEICKDAVQPRLASARFRYYLLVRAI